MKKNLFFAVAVIMMTLCAVVFSSCDDIAGERYSEENRVTPTPEKKVVRKLDCKTNRLDYNTSGAVQTRAISGTLDGKIDIMCFHKASWLYGTDTISHAYVGEFIVDFYDVKRTRYAHNIDIFKNPVITPQQEKEGILWIISFKDTETHDFDLSALGRPGKYESATYQVGDSLMALCQNDYNLFEMLDSKIVAATSPDDKYNAYNVSLYGQIGFEDGPDNKKTWMVTFLVLVPKDGPDTPIPEDKHDVIAFEEVNKGYDNVNDSVNNRWIDLVKVLSDGSKEPFPRVAFVSKNRLYAPAYQVKEVSDFSWQSQTAKPFAPVTRGQIEARENNIYVQPMSQIFTTYTDKGSCVFTGEFDGQAYFVDSLNQKHYFLYKEYTFEDAGWQDSNMTPTENFERKLLSSDIRGLFNSATLSRTGKIEMRKVKGEDITIIGYDYPETEKGIKPILPNSTYWTWRTQYIVFSNGKKEKVGEIGTTLNLKTVAPDKQVVTVEDWSIKDLSAQPYDATRGASRTDKVETGVFTIQSWSKNYVTRTNKSSDKFVTTYDGVVTFKDKYGQEVEFLGLAVKQEDKGGVATLKDLLEENGYERKSMTTSVAVTETHTSTSANYTAEVEFRKAKPEAPKLVSYEYKDFGIKPVIENKQYYTYCTQYAVMSDGTQNPLGTIGTDLYVSVTEPAKQTITVQDWNINDLSAVLGSVVSKGSRNDSQDAGIFKISKSAQSYTTKTNKSACEFVITYEGTVIFTDKFGKEVNFKGITISAKDNGGVKTLRDLGEADEMERKEMTSTITVTVNSTDNANYNGVVEFRKTVEKEELTDWKVTNQNLVYNGNGNWTSTTTVTYYWKLGGNKTENYSTPLVWNIVGEAKSQIILDEAKADYRTLNAGSETSSTSASGNITVVTKKKSYAEDYTTLKDNYTATMQTASYKSTVGGKTIAFDFLAPSGMSVAHKDGKLVDGKRTVSKGDTEYDVWDHTGSVTATVSSSKGSQTETATDVKEVLVKKEEVIIIPEHPTWGLPLGLASNGATLVYHKQVGSSQEGAFHKNLIILYEKGILVVTTTSYGMKGNNWNPMDFSFTEDDFYFYGKQYYGKTLTEKAKINSAILRNGKWEPALITMDGSGWVYVGISGNTVNMSQNLAVTAGIKNFNSETTAANNPYLRWSGKVDNNKVLTIYNAGLPVMRFK